MFASRPHDPDTGLINMRARWYSPDIGRFLSPDPAGLVDGTNLYAYASNDPVNFFDPSGLARQATQDNPGLGNPNLSEILHEILTKIPGAEALLSLNITGDDLLDAAELFLGIVGLVPAVGMIADGLSVAIAAARGNYGSALLSAAAFIPAIGMAAGGAKIAKIGARLGPKVVRAVKAIAKKSVGKLTKVFKRGPKGGGKLYRGVPGPHTARGRLGQQGIAKPRGTALDEASLRKHVLGEDVDAGVTSWTTKRSVAKRFSGSKGTIIEVDAQAVSGRRVPRPDVGRYSDETEVLLQGTIKGTPTKP